MGRRVDGGSLKKGDGNKVESERSEKRMRRKQGAS